MSPRLHAHPCNTVSCVILPVYLTNLAPPRPLPANLTVPLIIMSCVSQFTAFLEPALYLSADIRGPACKILYPSTEIEDFFCPVS